MENMLFEELKRNFETQGKVKGCCNYAYFKYGKFLSLLFIFTLLHLEIGITIRPERLETFENAVIHPKTQYLFIFSFTSIVKYIVGSGGKTNHFNRKYERNVYLEGL